jgi:hypothetical protein
MLLCGHKADPLLLTCARLQVGDPKMYTTEGDPTGNERIWTSLSQDPSIRGDQPRPAFVLDKDHIGVDALGSATAALAAAAAVSAARGDEASAKKYRDAAERLYAFARMAKPGAEASYCSVLAAKGKAGAAGASICQLKLNVSKSVLAQRLSSSPGEADRVRCWVPDYSTRTCVPRPSQAQCIKAASFAQVYTRRSDCCAELAAGGVWANQTTAQGACALPDDQLQCFIPSPQTRSCFSQAINITSGRGCTGTGLQIYASEASCCNSLVAYGVITPERPGTGSCTPQLDTALQMKNCLVPSLTQQTCIKVEGARCNSFGIGMAFSDPLQCCNQLVQLGSIGPYTGICSGSVAGSEAPGTAEKPQEDEGLGEVAADVEEKEAEAELPADVGSAAGPGKSSQPKGPAGRRLAALQSEHAAGGKAAALRSRRALLQTRRTSQPPGKPAGSPPPARRNRASTDATKGTNAIASTNATASTISIANDAVGAVPASAGSTDAAGTDSRIEVQLIEEEVTVEHFPSDSTLDDMALAGAWLYRATSNPTYLGLAQHYLEQHQQREAGKGLAADRK